MIAAVLAAGKSTRFEGCKQLHLINGKPMLQRVVESLPSEFSEVVVVTGAFREEIESLIASLKTHQIHNKNFERGIGTSVKVAAQYALKKHQNLLLTLGDLPFVTTSEYQNLLDHFANQVLFSEFNGETGPPAIFPKDQLAQLLNLADDEGAKSIFSQARSIPIPGAAKDIDFRTST